MKCIFLGVGEAFDETLDNTALLVTDKGGSLLIDCGFTAASAFWRHAPNHLPDPLELDAIYLTHFHGDHYFGLPALLVRMAEEGRSKPLTIIGPKGVERNVSAMQELAYAGTMSKAPYELKIVRATPEDRLHVAGFVLSFAPNGHLVPCQSIRVDFNGKSLFYSGDGRPTEETAALARGCDLVVHEAFALEGEVPGHGTVDASIDFALNAGAGKLALVHIQRRTRKERKADILKKLEVVQGVEALLPEPGFALQI